MSDQPTSIFRAEALRRRREQNEEIVLPRLVAPRTLRLLWLLAMVVLAALVAAWRTPVPTFVACYAVVESADAPVTLLVPADTLLPETPRVWLDRGAQQARLALVIDPTAAQVLTPQQLSARFGWCDVTAPLRLAVAHRQDAHAPALDLGRRYDAALETAPRRLLHWLPTALFGAKG